MKRIEVQTWGIAGNGQPVCAGVHWLPELTAEFIRRVFRRWRRWRKRYDNAPENRQRDYPAKHSPPVAHFGAHPIGNPEAIVWVNVEQTKPAE